MGLRGIPEAEILFKDMEVGDDMLVLPPRPASAAVLPIS